MGCSASAAFKNDQWARLQAVARSAQSSSRQVEDVMHSKPEPIQLIEHRHDVTSARQVRQVAFDLDTGDHLDKCKDVTIDDERIKNILSNLKSGELFCDPDFPADNSALHYADKTADHHITWLRPKDLVKKPVLLLDGTSRHDIVQGILGDCWFLSSCAAVARRNDLMQRVIPPKQELYGRKHKGLAQFRFWRFGEWIKVHIDDRLPVKGKKLIYARCSDPREFWVALLEKAYAKLHGCYELIEGGQAMDALVDLTSGLAERYDLGNGEEQAAIFNHLLGASHADAFITCSRKGDWKAARFADKNGLVSGHAYTISSVITIQLNPDVAENLVRIRNPWGNEAEWTGMWSDCSAIWETLDAGTKAMLNYVQKDDGEFWMSFKDFCVEFEEVSICTLGPDFDKDGIVDKAGQVKAIRGSWQLGKTCGGSRNDFVKFATNPQYLLILNTPEEPSSGPDAISGPDTRSSSAIQKCSVVIALMQEHLRSERLRGTKMLQIGFILYKTRDPFHRLTAEHFMYHYDHGSSGTYINYREIFGRFELRPGCYVIVPATFEPDCAGNFMIRVYAANNFELRELPS